MISVTIASPDKDFKAQWDDLIARAPGNVFMNPVALKAALDTMFAVVHVLLAWEEGVEPARLVGLWALQQRSVMFMWPALLEARPYNYAFLSTPVIDPAFAGEVIPAFFAAIRNNRALPNVVSLREMDAESQAYAAIQKTIADEHHAHVMLTESARPFVSRERGVKGSGSTRKKLRQDWNRLSALGKLEVVNERSGDAARAAFEQFLDLERRSWKGAEGTAILCDDHDAQFTRKLIGDLADDGNASVALLRLDDRPIAAQVVMYCGTTAYTWKIAFDSEFAKYSPGSLLVDKLPEQLFSSSNVQVIDSCSAETSFMAQLWTGRKTMVDMVVDVGSRRSLVFSMEAARQFGYEKLRTLRDRLRAMSLLPAKRRLAPSQ
ncbi:GNAT family N-acetyltransferase [Bradyrhizobium sp. SYSU BS000235]|uniref:GNAT family N-acetyltransferase n=1 Tax=Bradyrhizobium sp. SYSU BS000235 TaxID=3411332 RepID=UPI003C759400